MSAGGSVCVRVGAGRRDAHVCDGAASLRPVRRPCGRWFRDRRGRVPCVPFAVRLHVRAAWRWRARGREGGGDAQPVRLPLRRRPSRALVYSSGGRVCCMSGASYAVCFRGWVRLNNMNCGATQSVREKNRCSSCGLGREPAQRNRRAHGTRGDRRAGARPGRPGPCLRRQGRPSPAAPRAMPPRAPPPRAP